MLRVCRIPQLQDFTSRNQPYDCNLMLHTVLNKVGFLAAEVVSTSTVQVYHVYGEDLADRRTWLRFWYGCGESITEEGDGEIHGSFTVACRKGERVTWHPILPAIYGNHLVCNTKSGQKKTSNILRMASLLSSFHSSTCQCPLPCLKNSSMICSLHVLLRCKHREGLLMSAALIAICRREKGKVGMRLYRYRRWLGKVKGHIRADMKADEWCYHSKEVNESIFNNTN